jgi:RNA polymerase sigma-70 factor (ECF subfamily)
MAATCLTEALQTLSAHDCDESLMLRARSGDRQALDTLINRYRAAIIRFAYRMVKDRSAAEDIAQEVFLRVYRYREGYEVTAKFTTWLYRIAGRVALNWIRDHARARSHEPLELPRGSGLRRQFEDHTVRIDDWLMRENERDQLRRAVDVLPERQRAIVYLHKFEEIECAEIARMLGCSDQAVRSVLCRAYSNLREKLASNTWVS